MNRRIIDDAIARFVAGAMEPAEEREFLRRAEADPELRRALDAELSIDRTLLRDRDILPSPDPAVRATLVGLLDQAPRPRSASRMPWSFRIATATLMKGVAVAAFAGVASLAVIRYSGHSGTDGAAVHQPAHQHLMTAPVPAARPDQDISPVESVAPRSVLQSHAVVEDDIRPQTQARSTAPTMQPGRTAQAPAVPTEDLPVIDQDTMHLDVTINLDGISRAKSRP